MTSARTNSSPGPLPGGGGAGALTAVRDAARVCRHVQMSLDQVRAMTKDDRSPVTIADYASQAVVARALAGDAATVGQVLVAEESAESLRAPEHATHLAATVAALRESGVWEDATPDDAIGAISAVGDPLAFDDDRPWWTFDPIDGTKGFLRGQQYAVALACIRRGRVVLGIMACPNLSIDHDASVEQADPRGTMYLGAEGEGVVEWVLGRPDGRRVRPRSSPREGAAVLAESVDSGHSDHSLSARIMSSAVGGEEGGGEHRVVRLDSQAKYAVVARGQADAYLRLPAKRGYVERIWDHAAGSIIAREAGCVVTDMHGRELDFGRGRGLEANAGVVVAPPGLHAKIIAAIGGMYAAGTP